MTVIEQQDIDFPPMPPTDFIGGHLLSLRRDPLGFIMQNQEQYGGIVHLKFMDYDAYQVSDPELVHQILTSKNKDWHKSVVYKNLLSDYVGNGLLVSDGDYWRRQRKLMQPAFHTQRIDAYAQTMVDYTQELLQEWRDGETRDIAHDMMALTLRVVGKTLFDTDLLTSSDKIALALDHMLHDIGRQSQSIRLVRLPEWIPTPLRMRKRHTLEMFDEVIQPIIDERRAHGEDTGDLLSMLLLSEDSDGNSMTDTEVHNEAITLILAGHETTANALTWTLYCLSQNPAIADKLYAEVRDVLGERPPTLADLSDLTYTEMVLKEGMRVFPPVWSVSRQAAVETELGGYTIKPRRTAIVAIYATHHNPELFPKPDVFDPERFSDERIHDIPKHAYYPFGGGPRICIGNAFAMMEAKLILASIVQQYVLQHKAEHRVEPEALVTMRPKYGMQMVLQQRKS